MIKWFTNLFKSAERREIERNAQIILDGMDRAIAELQERNSAD